MSALPLKADIESPLNCQTGHAVVHQSSLHSLTLENGNFLGNAQRRFARIGIFAWVQGDWRSRRARKAPTARILSTIQPTNFGRPDCMAGAAVQSPPCSARFRW